MSDVVRDFIESSQYNRDAVLEDEGLFGRNFFMTGGAEDVERILDAVGHIRPRRVLDIGSGLGGPAFLMARRYETQVDGIDLARPMVELARERCVEEGLEGRVTFIQGDILGFDSPHR